MTKTRGEGTIMVLGLGNLLLGDEGFGVHVVRRLKDTELPPNVRVEEGGVGGFNLLGLLEGVERLLVVDAMMLESPPGELHFLKAQDVKEPGKHVLSFHQVGVLELVSMWSLLGYEPEVLFLVTRPQRIEWTTELSPPLQSAVSEATELLRRPHENPLWKGTETLCTS